LAINTFIPVNGKNNKKITHILYEWYIVSSNMNCQYTYAQWYKSCICEGTSVKSEVTLASAVTARDEDFLDAVDVQ
jgi:hypothetical protein